MLQAFAALITVLGLLVVAVRALRRLQGGAVPRRAATPLAVIGRLSLGQRQGIALVRVADRVLVVGLAPTQTSLLTELPESVLASAEQAAEPRQATPSFATIGSWLRRFAVVALLVLTPTLAHAQQQTAPRPAARDRAPVAVTVQPRTGGPVVRGPAAPQIDLKFGTGRDQVQLSGAVGVVVFLGFLTLLPAIVLLMTSFTRILVVLHFARSAVGTQTAPPTQLLVAIAVLLTSVVMAPVIDKVNRGGLQPYLRGEITQAVAYQRAVEPLKGFMLANTREKELNTFAGMTAAADSVQSLAELPTPTIVAAFVASELRTSFQMGFAVYLPFVIIDLVVASVLMSMGMFMVPPVMVSMPFKLLLFVLADGWTLLMQGLVASFRM